MRLWILSRINKPANKRPEEVAEVVKEEEVTTLVAEIEEVEEAVAVVAEAEDVVVEGIPRNKAKEKRPATTRTNLRQRSGHVDLHRRLQGINATRQSSAESACRAGQEQSTYPFTACRQAG